jgi:tetratricopeptide (TPR) repeat protein
METQPPRPPIPSADDLLDWSQPRAAVSWPSWGGAALVVIVVATALLSGKTNSRGAVELVSGIALLLVMGFMAGSSRMVMRRHRAEQARLEAAEELVQLRRWAEAADLLTGLLIRPLRSQRSRVQALLFMTAVLARFGRFEDVLTIQDRLLKTIALDEGGVHAVRLGRAMALLHEDRLFDADRAISELRRSSLADESAGLVLVEMYRDVKTGHPDEALAMFQKKLPLVRRQLGHRSADAWVLAARALDLKGRTPEALAAYRNATLLAPAVELQRRYPEAAVLADKYAPAPAPAEMA